MLSGILNRLAGIELDVSPQVIGSVLPIDIPIRYGDMQPKPIITWRYSTYDFDSVYQTAIDYNIAHDKKLAQILYESAKLGPGNGYIVELGTYYGYGTCMLASGSKASRREKVITIDNDKGETNSLYSNTFWERHPVASMRFEMNCIMMGIHDWIITIGGESSWAAQSLNIPVRVLFIDANHEYEGCGSDILLWKDKIIPGGLIILHDYIDPAVKRAIEEFIIKSGEFSNIIEITEQVVLCQKL